jgi:glutamate 5-kinase
MQAYINAFDKYNINVGQFLLTSDNLDNKKRFAILKETYNELVKNKEVPILNENDTIAIEEITFGDNDILAALITRDLNQDILINLTVYDGLLKNNKIAEKASSFDVKDYDEIGMERKEGRGGLKSKLDAAKIVAEAGKIFIISSIKFSIMEILSGKVPQTRFLPAKENI